MRPLISAGAVPFAIQRTPVARLPRPRLLAWAPTRCATVPAADRGSWCGVGEARGLSANETQEHQMSYRTPRSQRTVPQPLAYAAAPGREALDETNA
jgi:hypothetical protein